MSTADTQVVGATHWSTATNPTAPRMMSSRDLVLRIGACSGVVGALLAFVANLLHPHPTDYQLETLLDDIAQSSIWGAVHVALIVALVLVFVALVALTFSLEREPAATLGRMACVIALLGGALLLVSTALDGFAMRQLAADWAAAPVTEQTAALRSAAALEETQYAVYSLSTVLFLGIGMVLYGLATLLNGGYPRWLGWLAMLSGAGEVVVGLVQALSGPAYRGTELPDALFSTLLTLWVLSMSIVMWRRSRMRHTPSDQIESRPTRD